MKRRNKKRKKTNVYDKALELYNDSLGIYFDEFNYLTVAKRKQIQHEYDPTNLFLKPYNYDLWFENEELSDITRKSDKEEFGHLSDMSSLEGNEGLKILTLNKLLTRLSIILGKPKAGNNSCKLKHEIRQIFYLLYQHNKITNKFYNNLVKSS